MAQVPKVTIGPDPIETTDLHFKLVCKVKVFETESKYMERQCNILAVSQYYGVIFIGNSNGFSIIETKSLTSDVDFEKYPRKNVVINLYPTFFAVDSSQKILAVMCTAKPGTSVLFFDIQQLVNKDIGPMKAVPISKVVQNTTAEGVDLTWQPVPDGSLTICMSDGSVVSLTKGAGDGPLVTLSSTVQATCLCWSPKGKQIVIGCADGTLTQYKPDLKAVKTLPAPNLFDNSAMVVSVLWISSYQFAVAYNDRLNPETFPVITIVNAPKNEPINVINLDDVTYSTTIFRNHQVYMHLQCAWNLLFVCSANSIEVAVLQSRDNSSWVQLLLGDASRAELPLNPDRQETFPMGWGFDYTPQAALPWGEGTLPPMPRLLIVSDEGLLCVFNIVNTIANTPQICSPPKENLDSSVFLSALKFGSSATPGVKPDAKGILGSPPAFGTGKPAYGFDSGFSFGGFGVPKSSAPAPQAAPGIFQQPQDTKPQPALQTQQQQPSFGQISQQQPSLGLFQQQPASFTQPQQQQPSFSQISQQQTPFSQAVQQQPSLPQTTLQQSSFAQISQQSSLAPTSQQQPSLAPTSLQQPSLTSFSQQQPALPQISQQSQPVIFSAPTPASTTGFKPSVPQFGSTSAFTFGTNTAPVLRLNTGFTGKVNTDQPQAISLTVKPSPAQTDIFSGKTLPQSTPIKQPEVTIEKVPSQPVAVIKQPEVEPVKTEEISAQVESPKPTTPEIPVVDDSVYLSAIQDEIEHFNSELQQLSAKVKELDTRVGSEEDKLKMKKSIDGLFEFWKELNETTKAQSSEIHAVVMDLMESFAWLEDAKSRNLQRKNPSYIELKKSEELDPLSARHMSDISHLKYYIENQLKQLTKHLEKEWLDHQENYRNEVKNKMTVPPLEEVYKTMHFQLKILHKQKLLVEELKEKLASKKRKNKTHRFIPPVTEPIKTKEGNSVSELSKLAQNLLQLKINEEENSSQSGTWEVIKSQLHMISGRCKKLTREKQSALRDALSECDMVRIRPVKTTLETSTFLRSLALEKAASKAAREKETTKSNIAKPKDSSIKTNVVESVTVTSKPEAEKFKIEDKPPTTKAEPPKSTMFSTEKPFVSFTGQSLPKPEEKSPLASLSGIVSNIGNKPETKPFVFGSSNFQKPESEKEPVAFVSIKSDQKPEQKAPPLFTFGASKPGESLLRTKEPLFFGDKPVFTFSSTTPAKTESTKTIPTPNVTITPVTKPAATTTSSPFTFSAVTTTSGSTGLPKMNLLFSGKEQNTTISTLTTTGSFFSISSTPTQSTASSSAFGSGVSLFKNKPSITFSTSSSTGFGVPTTTSETQSQTPVFTFTQPAEKQSPKNGTVATPIKSTPETEDVDVVKVDEPENKPETPTEKPKDSPKTTPVFGTPPPSAKTEPEVTSPSIVTSQTTAPTTNLFSIPPAVTTAAESSTVVTTSTTVTAVTTSSVFSFSTSNAFGQTTTTSTPKTTASLFGTPTTTSSVFGQVSSTTPNANIFGSSNSSAPTGNLFGESTPTKPIFGQAATTPSTTAGNIFGGSTPTTSAFGQVSAPTTPTTPTTNTFEVSTTSTPTTFGQKSDSLNQTTNLFGQLLSDNNRSVFGNSATPTTAGNIFSAPKNLFGGSSGTPSTTTSSLFGTTSSSIFPQTTSVFGQPTTSTSVFGQPQTSTTNSFFGQNISSPFGGGTSVTSNQNTFESGEFNKPIFGQSVFGQSTNNTSIFGGSTSSPLFGGTSSTTAGNVFQTPTTSTAFGTPTPGPFSGGASSFGETSFGSPNSFQKPAGGFGSPPVFGGGPAFGGSPTFGGTPSFGSLPTFGSMSQGTFGQSSGSSTFENLANQNTVGFGNLAQQNQSQGFGGGFGGSPSFENKPAFGGNSFSSWRSK